jgi:hypothetical protein
MMIDPINHHRVTGEQQETQEAEWRSFNTNVVLFSENENLGTKANDDIKCDTGHLRDGFPRYVF